MSFRITATLKTGNVLEVDVADAAAAEIECRFVERLRKARWGLPAIYWRTPDGQRWIFAATEIVGEVTVRELEPQAAVAG